MVNDPTVVVRVVGLACNYLRRVLAGEHCLRVCEACGGREACEDFAGEVGWEGGFEWR